MTRIEALALLCCIPAVLSGMLGPCKRKDSKCIQETINEAFPKIFVGIKSKGVESSDPMFLEFIDGNLSVLKYKFFNSTVTGYKNCLVENSKLDIEALKLYFEMICTNIKMEGDYEIGGKLIALAVEGKGTYVIKTDKFMLSINSGLKMIESNNGKTYINIKNFELKPKALGQIEFQFNNLFNGRKDLSDAVHKFAHESYMEVAEFVQDPIFNVAMKTISKNINKFLKTEPLQEIFID